MAKLPPIQTLSECPHCGADQFYVMQVYSGKGAYYRRFDGYSADNTEMYNCLDHRAGKRAFCSECDKPVASWDEGTDPKAYVKDEHANFS
ncbi:TPA: hypothetical protein ACVFH3_006096 [Pseudomonas aeruginosa]|uniref:hypothetical protein n=1 Tax=Pseudomonas aeruginosa TaxID=287 RepID=UPI0029926C2A|nr:hypothetical protein [Pseudomonas aeruginosa]